MVASVPSLLVSTDEDLLVAVDCEFVADLSGFWVPLY